MDIWDNRNRVSLDEILETSQELEQSTICTDDWESSVGTIGMLPDESNTEHGSPLDFG